MMKNFSRWVTILGLSALSTITIANTHSNPVIAQETLPPVAVDVIRPGSTLGLDELMNKAYNNNTGSIFEQSSLSGQLNTLFGWRTFLQGSFHENSINRDGVLINAIQEDFFRQLTRSEPTIRTRDIPNPFNSSVQQNPSYLRK
jgi:hypothetical protein